jgi:hypothetical protein
MRDQTVWDKYNSIFEEIISLAASVVDTTYESSDPLKECRPKPSFSLDMGIVAPLYDVATLCRDPFIRRRAVNILRSLSRQEGVFSSHICAVVAEKVIAIEETVAAEGSLEYQKDVAFFVTIVSDANQQHHPRIERCSDVPQAARLSYAYPTFDIIDKKAFLTIGQEGVMHMNIPLPALTVMLSIEK